MFRAGLTSGTVMAGGDVLCQTLEKGIVNDGRSTPLAKASSSRDDDDAKSEIETWRFAVDTRGYDPMRTVRFGMTGLLLHGPFFNLTLGVLEKVVGPAVCARAAAKKVALGHFILFPSYTFLFYGYMSAFEGRGVTGGMQKLQDTWWDVWKVGTGFWPAANMVNFMFFPPSQRVLFLNFAGLFWNAFLSFQNAKSNTARQGSGSGSTASRSAMTVASAKEACFEERVMDGRKG